MALQINVSPDYGYVVLAAASTFLMNSIHGFNTGKYRKACKDMDYPIAYATPEQHAASRAHLLFSCAQRAHANYIENQPSALAAMLIAGLQYPRTAAALGAFWTVNRYIYMKGYVSDKGPKGRLRGGAFILAQLGLIGLCVVEGLGMAGWL